MRQNQFERPSHTHSNCTTQPSNSATATSLALWIAKFNLRLDIIRAIVAGEHDPQKLAQLRDPRTRRSAAEIARALHGDYGQEHLFILQQELALYDAYQTQIAACDRQIEQYLSTFERKAKLALPKAGRAPRKPHDNQPGFDLRTHLHRISGVDFTQIDGLGVLTVQTILSEVGLDPSRFSTVKQFASWLGLCPGSHITGGKAKHSHTRHVVNRAANAFRMAAQAVGKTQSAIGAFYRRLRTRLGAPKAITATAHKLARLFYQLWTSGQAYQDLGVGYYEQRYHEQLVKGLRRKAQALGFDLIATPSTPFVSEMRLAHSSSKVHRCDYAVDDR